MSNGGGGSGLFLVFPFFLGSEGVSSFLPKLRRGLFRRGWEWEIWHGKERIREMGSILHSMEREYTRILVGMLFVCHVFQDHF
ncbi:hypothetical protein QBC41DRAFT_327443 [Cercophora samala]|uniref:Uncharacterized protein n=1 Tax=Cercophora samala TaxID=330535 RepID=A0AA40D8J4_9PEZI|nr:hypothetical protein QBC41DRAFT_327443 [Cercophora samala]